MTVGDPTENHAVTTYDYDLRRRLVSLLSTLNPGSAEELPVVANLYSPDGVGNIVSISDNRDLDGTEGWSPESVDYAYEYDSMYRLTGATPTYQTGMAHGSGTDPRAGAQTWTHDYLGSMRTWNAVEDVAGEHFYDWSIGEIINGQQIIESSGSGLSSRCSAIPEAASRTSGAASHALYFAYQPTETADQFEGLEACYDPSGNMVALFRLRLEGCGTDPLDEASSDWDASCTTQTIELLDVNHFSSSR